ncbi:Conserved_hypothetical protein [Hexamita inflata]|uniref:Uncharacterized protein n=1 Tax=Hexamita inflata TaxID=28002 RepID=A0AA86RS46_9EUKA|nr:Conserved hypothetical protein [Hexamita inflata]
MNDVVNRIMQQYNPQNYLCKQNLLYLPDIKIAQGEHVIDVLPMQLGIKIDDQIRETIQKDTYCDFNDYVMQLCNTYAQLERRKPNFNPYKYWVMTKETQTKIQELTKNSTFDLKLFTKLKYIQEWVIKRSMLTDCDIFNQKIIYFEQDPTTMLSIQDPLNYRDYLNKYIDSNDQKAIQQNSQSVELLQKEIQELSKRYNLNIDNIVQEIATFGFGIGSSPAEVLCHYQLGYHQEHLVIIGKIIQLFAACRMTKSAFPWQFKGYTDDQSINYTYFHMENIRLMYLKISQIDYYKWLTKIQKISQIKSDQQSLIIIQKYLKNCYECQLGTEQQQGQEQIDKFLQMQRKYEEIDLENQQIMQIDQIFCQFIPENSTFYDNQKQNLLPIFNINDCNYSTFRQAWLVSTAFKVIFLTIFGQHYHQVAETCELQGFPLSLIDNVRKLYFQIQNLWSRQHDYMLMFLQTDLGSPQQLIHILDSPNEQIYLLDKVYKKLKIIQSASFIDNFDQVQNNPLVMLLNLNQPQFAKKLISDYPPNSFQKNYQFIYEKFGIQKVTDCSNPQVLKQNLTLFKTFKIEHILSDIQPSYITTQSIIQRMRILVKALRIEHQLIADPLEQFYSDEFINSPPEMLETRETTNYIQ